MTRITIFCHGIWNSPDLDEPTGIHKLQGAFLNDPSTGQVCAYFAGIGTDNRFDGSVEKFFNKWGGGICGWGLVAKSNKPISFCPKLIKQTTRFICSGSLAGLTRRGLLGA
ncbi:DUF2235 domain-containing protein [Ascidiaceihabitans sp.]|nr:DUF2235 domain-containing protein [Ascidiaceihabitans sp.]